MNREAPIIITGGGPTGLFLAICLLRRGIGCTLLESRQKIGNHSRSLGIHPVSLEGFDEEGIAEPFVEKGIRISQGHAFAGDKRIGTVRFENCPPPWNFVLSLPQSDTEKFLEQILCEIDPDCLQREVAFRHFRESDNGIRVTAERAGEPITLTTEYLIGCDGSRSSVREAAGIDIETKPYADQYVMGDFSDNTPFGADAVIFTHREGVVESFPMPGEMRRWVVKRKRPDGMPTRSDIEIPVLNRTGIDLSGATNRMRSGFGTENQLATTLWRGRVLLAGDAAHVVSPIGGQGMNLGWLDARELANSFAKLYEGGKPEELFGLYSEAARNRAKRAAARAEMNMFLGRESGFPLLREWLLRGLLIPPLNSILARLFTMRGLDRWPI